MSTEAKATLQLRAPKTDRVLARKLEVPRSLLGRGLGLSFRSRLEAGHGMWIRPCNGIHMFFMRFALDLVFLDRAHRVRRVYRNVSPWVGLIPYVRGASSVVELAAGTLEGVELHPGDQLEIAAAD